MCANRKYRWYPILWCGLILICNYKVSGQAEQEFKETIYFRTGSFILDSAESQKLYLILSDTNYLTGKLEISGYTDSVGTVQANKQLSFKRSESVVEWFSTRNHKVKFEVRYFGKLYPVSAGNMALNRRAEIRYKKFSNQHETPSARPTKVIQKLELNNTYFKPDEAILESASMPYLDQLAAILKKDTLDRFEIRGHVNWHPLNSNISDSGYRSKMFKLSADRARTVYEILIDKGVPAAQMTWKGLGNTEMLFPNASNDEEKRRNMRVEILIIK